MRRRFTIWLYRRIDESGRIPRWVRWIWRSAHWCPEMDDMLIMDNTCDCFCGHAKQVMVVCSNCGSAAERRFTTPKNVCLNCIPELERWLEDDPTF